MGGIFSQENSSGDEITKMRDSLGLTPSQQLGNPRLRDVRLLALDPRSPSEFISRTPIVVEKTPEVQAKKMKPSCGATSTPQEGPVITDPRSPTRDFARTPLYPCHSSSGVIVQRNVKVASHTEETEASEPKSCLGYASQLPVSGSDPTGSGGVLSLLEKLESGKARSILENPESETISTLENPESGDVIEHGSEVLSEKGFKSLWNLVDSAALDVIDAQCDVIDAPCDSDAQCDGDDECDDEDVKSDDNDGCKVMKASTKAVDNKLISKVNCVEESTPKLAALIPAKSDNRIRMKPKMLSLQATVPRSPLSAVQNSHRIMSDRYNSVKVKPNHTNNMLLDKENVFH